MNYCLSKVDIKVNLKFIYVIDSIKYEVKNKTNIAGIKIKYYSLQGNNWTGWNLFTIFFKPTIMNAKEYKNQIGLTNKDVEYRDKITEDEKKIVESIKNAITTKNNGILIIIDNDDELTKCIEKYIGINVNEIKHSDLNIDKDKYNNTISKINPFYYRTKYEENYLCNYINDVLHGKFKFTGNESDINNVVNIEDNINKEMQSVIDESVSEFDDANSNDTNTDNIPESEEIDINEFNDTAELKTDDENADVINEDANVTSEDTDNINEDDSDGFNENINTDEIDINNVEPVRIIDMEYTGSREIGSKFDSEKMIVNTNKPELDVDVQIVNNIGNLIEKNNTVIIKVDNVETTYEFNGEYYNLEFNGELVIGKKIDNKYFIVKDNDDNIIEDAFNNGFSVKYDDIKAGSNTLTLFKGDEEYSSVSYFCNVNLSNYYKLCDINDNIKKCKRCIVLSATAIIFVIILMTYYFSL